MSFGRVVGWILGSLVLVGVLKGLGDVESFDGSSLGDVALSIVNGVSDLTIKLIPTIFDAINNIIDS